jgi:hypothetical protein
MVDQIASRLSAPVTGEIVDFALRELRRNELLQTSSAAVPAHEPRTTRRELIRKLGVSAALLVPLITAIDAPKAIAQASGGNGGCVLPDTPVLLAEGSVMAAGQIVPGQWLRSVDPVSGATRPGRVQSIHPFLAPRLHTLFTECGAMLQASPDHLLISRFRDRDGQQLTSMQAGNAVLVSTTHGRIVPTRISAITTMERPQTVLGIEMDTWEHTLITGGIVSHNVEPKQSFRPKPPR